VQPNGVDVCGTSRSHEAPTQQGKAGREVLEEKEQTSTEMSLPEEISHMLQHHHLQTKSYSLIRHETLLSTRNKL